MSVKFEIPYFTVSGVTVRQGRVHSERRQCYRPVKPLGTWRLLRSLVTRHRRHRHDLRHSITAELSRRTLTILSLPTQWRTTLNVFLRRYPGCDISPRMATTSFEWHGSKLITVFFDKNRAVDTLIIVLYMMTIVSEESKSRFNWRCRGRFGFGLSTCSACCICMFSLPGIMCFFYVSQVQRQCSFQDAPMAALARFGCTAVADISCQCRVQNLAQPWGKKRNFI